LHRAAKLTQPVELSPFKVRTPAKSEIISSPSILPSDFKSENCNIENPRSLCAVFSKYLPDSVFFPDLGRAVQ
jgi:hypothetical protein